MLTLDKINEKIEQGYVRSQQHPDYPQLSIFNYTQTCQYEKAWDDVTRACRGLIMDTNTGEVVAKPWDKFFNLAEHDTIPDGAPLVTEKIDGSLGIVFWYDNQWHIATRGSFNSDQAKVAKQFIAGKVFPHGYTHLFEIIYPENRIVVDYGDFAGLIYLESLTLDGTVVRVVDWPYVAEYYGKVAWDALPVQTNAEGYVLHWPEENFRVKMKFNEYVRLHRIMTDYSIKRLWEVVSTGEDLDAFLQGVPDEFYAMVHKDGDFLNNLYMSYSTRADALLYLAEQLPTRKEQAEMLIRVDKDTAPVVFKLLDGKQINDDVWKKVRQWLN